MSKQPSKKSSGGRLPKTHADYWETRLFKNSYSRRGKVVEVRGCSVKIQHLGIRKTFSFDTTNKHLAAIKARDLYLHIVANGWDSALAVYNPEMAVQKDDPTLGEFFTEVKAKSGLKTKTLDCYTKFLRSIVGGIFNITAGREKFDYRAGGNLVRRKAIDATRLSAVTPDKIQAWKVKYLREAGDSPAALQSARRTVNTYIRCSRSLFSLRILKFLTIKMPLVLPFAGIELEKSGSMKYQSRIDPQILVAAARAELAGDHPESYKAFLLGLFCGLRRAEMDSLEWSAVDWGKRVIRLTNTEVLSLKSDDSQADVEVDQEVLDELREFMQRSQSLFVLASPLSPRPGSKYQFYRCKRIFDHLITWLRSKGVQSNKPLHELRKEFGSLINQKHGLFAAAQALRHSDITTSARHYIARKERVTVGLGGLLRKDVDPPE